MGRRVGIYLAVLAVGSALFAAASAETRVALVIGNGEYTSIPSLRNAKNDADAMADALTRSGFLVVGGVHHDLNRDALIKLLFAFAPVAAKSDVALFYYAGHGISVGGIPSVLPVDMPQLEQTDGMTPNQISFFLGAQTVSLSQIMLNLVDAKKTIIIVDACRDDPIDAAMTKHIIFSARSYLNHDNIVIPYNTLIVYPTSVNRQTIDTEGADDRNGPFVKYFLRHYGESGSNIDKILGEIADDLHKIVVDGQHVQTMDRSGGLDSDSFYFLKPASDSEPSGGIPPKEPPPPDPWTIAPIDAFMRGLGAHEDKLAVAQQENFAAARRAFEQTAKDGKEDAVVDDYLGVMLLKGWGGGRDVIGGLGLLKKAADKGSVSAAYTLGATYYLGIQNTVEVNYVDAASWLTKSYRLAPYSVESKASAYYLGRIYESKRDLIFANFWMQRASDLGNKDATAWIDDHRPEGR